VDRQIMTVVIYILLLLSEHHGQVTFGGVPVPGATVTVTQGEKTLVTVTDQRGVYSFPDLADGPFTIQVEMLGFSTVKQEVNAPTAEFELKMLPIEEIHAEVAHESTPEPTPAAPAPATKPAASQPKQQKGFQRTEVNASNNANSTAPADDSPPQSST